MIVVNKAGEETDVDINQFSNEERIESFFDLYGWVNLSESQLERMAEELREEGYIVVKPKYMMDLERIEEVIKELGL